MLPVFTKFANVQQHRVKTSDGEFHPNRTMHVEIAGRNLFRSCSTHCIVTQCTSKCLCSSSVSNLYPNSTKTVENTGKMIVRCVSGVWQ